MNYFVGLYVIASIIVLVSIFQVSGDEPYKSTIAGNGFEVGFIMALLAAAWPVAIAIAIWRGGK